MTSATEKAIKHNRAQMRGKPLSKDCYRANASYHEYVIDDHDFTGCYGLMDWPENVNAECLECGAYVHGGEFEKRAKEVIER